MTTWFITGTATGFGRAVTRRLPERGDTVAATLRRPDRLDDLKAMHGDRLWTRDLDVTDIARLRQVVDDAFTDLGRIDVVLSNAGFGVFGAAEELTDEQIDSCLAANLSAGIHLARAVVPHLRRQGGGRFVQITSQGGQIAYPGFSIYHAAKWGLEGFFEAMAPEVEPFGIRVTMVEPGMADTGGIPEAPAAPHHPAYRDNTAILRQSDVSPADLIGDPDKVAAAIIALGEQADPPLRQALGSDAYANIRAALTDRLAALEQGRAVASSTDRT
ncbi:SDR family oxidoreductase [Actinoplanes friuliensis]|uniref:Short-chain dehydrogenase/reductase SDR n=1 Tax=Actinoplanes friuliensis DSM 7358 TaxID=1246995 RepID=U5VVQ6_9ACTN|nr:SDR family oxidoreductase [Actinoplanes friuliensis]AGZ40959.1 short-chain dehydrogenase/reductase SDR [Actinoplanes friuliensis DSM 7358]